jgi:hypothetical protein
MTWQVITAANVAIAAAYFGIAWIIFSGLRGTNQLGTNKLATTTDLLSREEQERLGPGDLRRSEGAGVSLDPRSA